MALVPRTTNEGTPTSGEPFVFPAYENIVLPYIATLSLPGLTIGLPVWLFSTQVILNVASASVASTSPQEHQPHVDPLSSSPVRSSSPSSYARYSSVSYSSPSEISEASNLVDKKKKKRKIKKTKNKKGSKLPTTSGHVGKQPVTINHPRNVYDSKITQTTHKPNYPSRLCKGRHLLKDLPSLSRVIEAWSTHSRLPSTSQDTIGKNKSRVKFPCRLCRGSHQTHLFPRMDEASKLLEDMIVSQPQIPYSYRNLTLNPPVVDGMINPVPLLVRPIDQVVNLVTSLVEAIDQVVAPILSSLDLTLLLESETQPVDPFPTVDPILPLENATLVVDLILSSVDPTLPL
jgi:hypothetical protein